MRRLALLAIGGLLLAGCSGGDKKAAPEPSLSIVSPTPTPTATPTPSASPKRKPSATPHASKRPSATPSRRPASHPPTSRPHRSGTLVTDLHVPWGITFLPNGDALVA